MKRNIRYIVVHSTATPQDISIKALCELWKEKQGGEAPPYHFVVDKNGELIKLLNENCITSGDFLHNAECMHIAYIGGIDKEGAPVDNRTEKQKEALYGKLVGLSNKYRHAEIIGASEIKGISDADTAFDVKKWLREYTPDLSEMPCFESLDYMEEAA